jgi:hypothetical protein
MILRWLIPFAGTAGVVIWQLRPDPGKVEVRFERWERTPEFPKLILSVSNGTRHLVGIEIACSENVTSNQTRRLWTGPTPLEGFSHGGIPPHSKGIICVNNQSAQLPSNEVHLFVPPWTSEQADASEKRREKWPGALTRWLPQYPKQDPQYRYTVEVPDPPVTQHL